MKIPILMYHSITDPESSDPRPPGYWLPPTIFEKQLVLLAENNFRPITLRDFSRARGGEFPLPEKAVVITFDDGYFNNYLRAFPLLCRFGFRASFFFTVSALGKKGMMGIPEAEKLLESGMEIGSHGMSHDLLVGRDRAELTWELEESKQYLARVLKTEVDFFSLPRGYLPPRFSQLAAAAGYRGMCTSNPGYNSLRTDPFRWRRFPIRTGFGLNHLAAILRKRGYFLWRLRLVENFRAVSRFRYRWRVFG